MIDVESIAARLRADPRVDDVTLAGAHNASEPARRVLVRTRHEHGRAIADLIEELGGTVTVTGWETANIEGPFEGRLEALISLRQGLGVLAELLLSLDQAGANPIGELKAEQTALADVPWAILEGQTDERTGKWAIIALHEHTMSQLEFASAARATSETVEVLTTLLCDLAVELGIDVDSWYTYEEIDWLLTETSARSDLLDVAKALSLTKRQAAVTSRRKTSEQVRGR